MPHDSDDPRRRLTELSEEESRAYLRRSSLTFLECAIHLCVTHMGLEEVARILEEEASILREHR